MPIEREDRLALADDLKRIASSMIDGKNRRTITKAITALRLSPVMEGSREALIPLARLYNLIDHEDSSPDSTMFFQHDACTIEYGDIRRARAALSAPHPQARGEDRLTTTRLDDVLCKQLTNCGWPECDCPRKANVHSPEAVAYAFNKAIELLVAAGFEETAAILRESKSVPARPSEATAGREVLQKIADYIYEETTKLDAPISMTACLVMARHIAPNPQAMAVREMLDQMAPAVENLACHQERCDIDGVMVKVSRQALDEVLRTIDALSYALPASRNGVDTDGADRK